jgi:hypothetical protein
LTPASSATLRIEDASGPPSLKVQPRPGSPSLLLTGQPGQVHILEGSSDLNEWSPILTNRLATGELKLPLLQFEQGPHRFLRALRR